MKQSGATALVGAGFAHYVKAARCARVALTIDEEFVTLCSESYLLWGPVDQHSVELDILLHKRRVWAAKRFFKRALADCPEAHASK
ncbi:DDE-type integrase/transposase/recombinase [Caballeronia sp. 15715]|uniref:DDE-type integrase/transposase/recombinase n=1 Tax=Caballeronia sp. 15715 TaxID=3391030 RepID=UPI0039E52F45